MTTRRTSLLTTCARGGRYGRSRGRPPARPGFPSGAGDPMGLFRGIDGSYASLHAADFRSGPLGAPFPPCRAGARSCWTVLLLSGAGFSGAGSGPGTAPAMTVPRLPRENPGGVWKSSGGDWCLCFRCCGAADAPGGRPPSLRSYVGARPEGHVHFLADRVGRLRPSYPPGWDQGGAGSLLAVPPTFTRQGSVGSPCGGTPPHPGLSATTRIGLTVIQNGFGDINQVGQGGWIAVGSPTPCPGTVQEVLRYGPGGLGDGAAAGAPGAGAGGGR